MSLTDDRARDFWNPRRLAACCGGRWLGDAPATIGVPGGVSIDTRTLEPGQVFLALTGTRVDGHAFLDEAARRGAAAAIVSREIEHRPARLALLHVDESVAALHRLAAAWRDVLAAARVTVIAVGGSNGKTTTRQMIHHLLQGEGTDPAAAAPDRPPSTDAMRGIQSPKSYNNHLGVPLTLLAIQPGHDFGVVEIGTNHPGEIAQLAALARPDIAVLCSIGREHLEHLHSLQGVAREEAGLLNALAPGGVAVVEAQAYHHVRPHLDPPNDAAIVRFGRLSEAEVRVSDACIARLDRSIPASLGQHVTLSTARGRVDELALPLLGEHNAVNLAGAVAVAEQLGVGETPLRRRIATLKPAPGRLEPMAIGLPDGAIELIHDAYNANPDSMEAALRTLAAVPSREGGAAGTARRVAILGDMLELGEAGPSLHRDVGRLLTELAGCIDHAVLVGPLMAHASEPIRDAGAPGVTVFDAWDESIPARLAEVSEPGDIVLIKASRSMGLERVIPALQGRFADTGRV